MFIKNKFLIVVFILSSNLFGSMIGSLGNKDISISGVFLKSSKSVYFAVVSNENNFSIWQYSNDRKYKPIHNAKAFDGYESAENTFDSIVIDKDYQYANLTTSINNDYDYLSKEKLDIVHILIKSSKHNLLINKKLSSIWEYLDDGGRKYRPIHNTDTFDGYEGAKKIFNNISLSGNSMRIQGINEDNYIEFKQKEYATNKTKAIKIVNSKDYESNYEKLGNNLIKDKANDLIWFDDENITALSYKSAKEYCNNIEIGGYNNFRIPNMFELMSLFDSNGKHKDIFNLSIFKNNISSGSPLHGFITKRGYFSNQISIEQGRKRKVTLDFTLIDNKTYSMIESRPFDVRDGIDSAMGYAKCVQSELELSSPILVRDNEKEIVKDITNNLIWQDNIEVRYEINEKDADNYCKTNTLSDYSNWDVPTMKEIMLARYNNQEASIVNDFYNWNSYYTLSNDKLSTKAQEYIIDNSQKMSKNANWIYGTRQTNFDNMPKEVRDNILDVLEFEKDTQAEDRIKSAKKSISNDDKKIEITKENYKDIKKKYEDGLAKVEKSDEVQTSIPSGSLLLKPSNSKSYSSYEFTSDFFYGYFASRNLKDELRNELEHIRYAETKRYYLGRLQNNKDSIIFYQNQTNAQNLFMSSKLLKFTFTPYGFAEYYFDNYLDIHKRGNSTPLGSLPIDISVPPHIKIDTTMVRKICIKRGAK